MEADVEEGVRVTGVGVTGVETDVVEGVRVAVRLGVVENGTGSVSIH